MGSFHLWAQITADPDLPPYFPYLLVAIDATDGRIVGTETLRPAPSFAEMWQQVPSHLARLLGQTDGLMATVLVDSDRLMAALGPLLAGLGVSLVEARALPHLDEVRHGLARDLAQTRRAGGLMPALQRYFPAWQRRPSHTPWLTTGVAGAAVAGTADLTVIAAETTQPAALSTPERRPGLVVKVALSRSWRRLALPADRSMHELAQEITRAFDFILDSPYTFYRGTQAGKGQAIGSPGQGEGQSADQTRIDDLKLQPNDRLVLRYDLGNPLVFRLQIEEVGPREGREPELLEGQGRPPTRHPG